MPADAKLKARWRRCNNVIMTWILNSVSKNVQEIANLMQGDMDVSSYHEKLVNLWHELDSMRKYKLCAIADDCLKCQETKAFYDQEKEEGRVSKFLMGLNESFTHIRTHIIALRELPSLDVAYDMVSTNESERTVAKIVCIEASAMYAQQESSYKQQMQSQRSGGNSAGNFAGKMKQRPYCTDCQLNGHTKKHCYNLNGYPPGHRLYKGKGSNQKSAAANNVSHNIPENGSKTVGNISQASSTAVNSDANPFTIEQVNQIWNMIKQQNQGTTDTGDGQCNMAGICSLVLHSLAKHSWIVDSGATDHFICDKSLLVNVYELPRKYHISLPDGQTIVVSLADTYQLRPGLVLLDVLQTPNFKYNLLSVSKLVKDNLYFSDFH
ncbi:unnamed protein product [Rhodiola kirilowii]